MNSPVASLYADTRGQGIHRLLNAKSIAIIGMSSKPNSAGHAVLKNLRLNNFQGDIHLVGRTAAEVDGVIIKTNMADLPLGVDVAVLTLPAASVGQALADCASRRVASAIVFASGFAEAGDAGRHEQERISAMVRKAGMVVVGPNCIGYHNYTVGLSVTFIGLHQGQLVPKGTKDAVAIISQSGGLANHLRHGLIARGVSVSYNISTGNEMDLGLGDFVNHLVDDPATRVIMIYAEDIRRPDLFLQAAARARSMGKPIVMLFPGRSPRAQEAAKSHTGALASDYAVMKIKVERAGIYLAEKLDEFLDVAEILARHPVPSPGGLGIMTFSGAFCGIAHDFCADLDVEIPHLSPETEAELKEVLPEFISPKNPIDLGTEAVWRPQLIGQAVSALLKEPSNGGVAISIPVTSPAHSKAFLEQIVEARATNNKPMALAMLGDQQPLSQEFIEIAKANKIVLSRSSDRIITALARIVKQPPAKPEQEPPESFGELPAMPEGTLPEWLGKKVISAAGIAVPAGRLAITVDDALAIAREIGFPVVIKAQAVALAHKTEAGGVILNLADETAVRAAWSTLHTNVAEAQPGLKLEGVLVEKMSAKGLELVIGGRRDPRWGPIVLIGLGGILVEALHDVRLVTPDATKEEIVAEFGKLKASKMLFGFRNLPPVDLDAAAEAAMAVGRLLITENDISEIDINPLMVYERGQGAIALDALVVTTRK